MLLEEHANSLTFCAAKVDIFKLVNACERIRDALGNALGNALGTIYTRKLSLSAFI